MIKKIIFTWCVFTLVSLPSVYAEIKLPEIISSNMVLQRGTEVSLWGWARSRELITIECSWLDKPIVVIADNKGNWSTTVKTTFSKEEQSINLSSYESRISLTNILFGEVWLCSGQSNMLMPLKGFSGQPVHGSNMAIANSFNKNLRLFKIPTQGSKSPSPYLLKSTSWEIASQESVWRFSAIGYFFGMQLQEILDVPVGIILAAKGGSSLQTWISREGLLKHQNIEDDIKKNGPTSYFNGMINPIIPYNIKGCLWYQGESNFTEPDLYKKILPEMVMDWRKRWDIGEFPFFFVQLPPYYYRQKEVCFNTAKNSAFMREAQLACVELIPNSGIVVTMDLGEKFMGHPPRKKEIADRLLFHSLNQVYGYTNVDAKSPVYSSFELLRNGMLLKFKNVERGLYKSGELTGFEIAGDDHVFYPASASIVNWKEVFVESDYVKNPKAVRYAWRNWIKGTLFEDSMLPVSSFRTDDWEYATIKSLE